jgi:hypothetical protein
METKVITKTEADVMSRELNIKVKNDLAAKAAAKADMSKEINHNIVTGEPLSNPKAKGKGTTPTKGKVVVKGSKTVTPPKKEAKPKLSEFIDTLIEKGGDWPTLIAEANKFCKDNQLKSKITAASFKTQVYWRRTVQGRQYMEHMELTDKGIFKVKKATKK